MYGLNGMKLKLIFLIKVEVMFLRLVYKSEMQANF